MSNQKEIREQLVKVIQENPELEIITLADNNHNQCYGNLKKVGIDYFYKYNIKNCLKSLDKEFLIGKFLDKYLMDDHFSEVFSLKDITNMAEEDVEDLDWKKVIVIYIGV